MMLRGALILLFLVFVCKEADAFCVRGGISIWPKAAHITKNQLFFLYGRQPDRRVARHLGRTQALYLEAEGEQVPLKVLEIHSGRMWTNQVVLQPVRPLAVGRTYVLKVRASARRARLAESLTRHYQDTGGGYKLMPNSYSVVPSDSVPPSWAQQPTYKRGIKEHMSCYGVELAVFALPVAHNGSAFVRAEIRKRNGLRKTTLVYDASDDSIRIGHTACGGLFRFSGKRYKARFTLLDEQGNAVGPVTAYIPFPKPVAHNQMSRRDMRRLLWGLPLKDVKRAF